MRAPHRLPNTPSPRKMLDRTSLATGSGPITAKQVLAARPLSSGFFNRDPVKVARELLGKLLVRREGRRLLAGRVVEDEAYLGTEDPAAHAFGGETARNNVLFGPPGHAYVYFIYGNHYCLNVSCMPEGNPGCVLFRALEPVLAIEKMAEARGIYLSSPPRPAELRLIASGPGRLCSALSITRQRDNGKQLTSGTSDLWLADDGFRPERVVATPRVGITKAVQHPWRFLVAGNAFVSGKRVA